MLEEEKEKSSDGEENKMLNGEEKRPFQVDQSLVSCGVASCRPGFAQRFASTKAFTVNYFVIQFLYIAAMTYSVGVRRTMEKRFGLRSVQTGYMSSANDIATACFVIFIGYIGDRSHKPRLISVMMALSGVTLIFFFAGTYFYLPANSQIAYQTSNGTQIQELLCSDNGFEEQCSEGIIEEEVDNNIAFYILFFGSIIIGISTSSSVVAFPYIDQNINQRDAAMYVGFISIATPIAPMFGFGLSAVALTLPENLIESPYDTKDPRFIGAWWLGYLVYGILLTLSCFPMFFFPKHLEKYYTEKQKENNNSPKKHIDKGLKGRIKEFFSSTYKILSNLPLLMMMACSICAVYVMQLSVNLPRYLEVHFGLSASTASIMMGLAGALASCAGKLLGALIMKKTGMKPKTAALFLCGGLATGITGLTILMLIPCQTADLSGTRVGKSLDLDLTCNSNCSCDRMKFNPVCDSSGMYHFSPCHAGCETKFENQTYAGCRCSGDGKAAAGICERSCVSSLAVYGATVFAMGFGSSLSEIPTVMLLLRIVGDKEKSMAFGVISCAVFLVGLVPGPVVFGSIIDGTCLVWQKLCSGTGVCLHFDSVQFRLKLHGTAVAFMFGALVFAVINYFLVRRLDLEFGENDHKRKESGAKRKEEIPLS